MTSSSDLPRRKPTTERESDLLLYLALCNMAKILGLAIVAAVIVAAF